MGRRTGLWGVFYQIWTKNEVFLTRIDFLLLSVLTARSIHLKASYYLF